MFILSQLVPQKTAVAVAYCKRGRGLIKINGCPIQYVQPEGLRTKVMEPIMLLGFPRFANVDIRIRVKGGGYTAQLYGKRTIHAFSFAYAPSHSLGIG